MIVLALDTALAAASVAVLDGGRARAVRSEPMLRGHQERIGGLVRDAMAEAGLPFAALDRIGVTVGPGSFTGLRVGLAFAKGLGLAIGRPCVGLGTLEALAASAWATKAALPDFQHESAGAKRPVAAVIDAGRGQVYLQLFTADEGGLRAATAVQALPLEIAAAQLKAFEPERAAGPSLLTGPGAGLLAPLKNWAMQAIAVPDPVILARLAESATPADSPPRPLYLRPPDARTLAERMAGTAETGRP